MVVAFVDKRRHFLVDVADLVALLCRWTAAESLTLGARVVGRGIFCRTLGRLTGHDAWSVAPNVAKGIRSMVWIGRGADPETRRSALRWPRCSSDRLYLGPVPRDKRAHFLTRQLLARSSDSDVTEAW